ncbi:hypothetical protein DUI87_24531 [Hirundo rustica rustica]|uniref:Uncharacterized protein n=1 Tax=Hirundo rustica rustica TaxID=333673 RepID=A0A3M0JVK7_HIRRU|nr:hypothetical protein DUI87_24531 [Hirundo rustica rustica]
MEGSSNPMEEGGVQVSKPTKVKKILFHLSLPLQRKTTKIAQGVMLNLYQDGLDLVLVHTGWKETEGKGEMKKQQSVLSDVNVRTLLTNPLTPSDV